MTNCKKKEKLLITIAASLLTAACAVFEGCGAKDHLVKLAVPHPLGRSAGGSFATTDNYLTALKIPNPSERVLATMARLPESDAMIFIARESDPDVELIYRSIAYLSWPRQVGVLYCGMKGDPLSVQFQPQADKKIRWLLFYRLQPPGGISMQADIGSHLKLIPIDEVKEWTFYCSQ